MNKLLITAALAALTVTVTASEFGEAWGGAHLEKWWDAQARLTGSQFAYHGALNTPEVRLRVASWSPWDGEGNPPFDFEVGRGTVYKWKNGEVTGYNWWQWADGTTKREEIQSEGSVPYDPFPFNYMRGLYENRDELGSYRMVGECFLEVRNKSEQTIDFTLNCEWAQIPETVSRLSEDKFYVKPGELGGVVPELPGDWRHGWIVVDVLTGRGR